MASIQADVAFADHFLPLRDLALHVGGKLLRRAGLRLEAALREPLLDRSITHNLGECAVELHHHVARRAGRRDESLPRPGFESRLAPFADRRQIWQPGDAL